MLTRNKTTKFIYSFLAFLLIITTVLPSTTLAAEGESIGVSLTNSGNAITEAGINSIEQTVTLTLADQKWASDIDEKLQLIKDLMVSNVEKEKWNEYKETHIAIIKSTDTELLITLKQDANYNIKENQEITLNLSAALIENWEGQVETKSFTIYAKPELNLGGTILTATAEDIQKGGKTIELNLLNAKWDQGVLSTITKWNELLDGFDGWSAIDTIKKADPNTVISYSNDNRTLTIKLPPITGNIIGGTVNYNVLALTNQFIIDPSLDLGSTLYSGDSISFDVKAKSDLNVDITKFDEAQIKSGNAEIVLNLTNVKWVSDLTLDKKQALIDALVATKQKEEWEKVKKVLTTNNVNRTSDNTVTITIPEADFSLSADEEISLQVPYQLLVNDYNLPAKTFTVKASPKVLIGGTATPSIGQMDVVKGGKTITLTLVNAIWKNDVATNTANRETLLNGFTLPTNLSMDVLKANADVKRTSATVVTITLPPINGFKVDNNNNIMKFTPMNGLTGATNVENTIKDVTTIQAVSDQSVTLSGTILDKTNEFDIAHGGKTIILKLKNDIWAKDVSSIMDGFSVTELNGSADNIERISDTEVKITLKAVNSFSLTNDADVDLVIPANLLTTSIGDISLNSAFKIAAVKAELTGNALTDLDSTTINKGGKTITISLKNATFKTGADFDKELLIALLDVINGNPDQIDEWYKVQTALLDVASKNISVTGNKITIKLPPVPNYYYESGMEIGITISKDLINNATKNIVGDQTIKIGQVAMVSLTGNALTESKLKSSQNKVGIKLIGTTWDPTIVSSSSKQSTLLKGFTTDDQTKEWAAVVAAIKSSTNNFKLNDDKDELEITIPKVSDYAIIRNQEVSIKIPKSVLVDYKYDIVLSDELLITAPRVANPESFTSVLPNLTQYIADKGLENIRVSVPEKKVETIQVSTVEVPGATKSTITTIVVKTNNEVTKATVTVGENTQEKTGNETFVFVFSNLDPKSDLKISVSNGNNLLQADIFKKVGKGNKTYNELPKKPISGSYSLYSLLTDKSLLKDIFKYYSPSDLGIGTKID